MGDYEAGYWSKYDDGFQYLVFQAMVSAMDTEIGRLLEEIDHSNTYVIFIGDNGTESVVADPALVPRGHAKASLYEGGVNVPFIISGPEVNRQGERTDVLTHTSDLYSTILAIAGDEVDAEGRPESATQYAEIDGRSLLPVVSQNAEDVDGREYVATNMGIWPGENPVLLRPGYPRGLSTEGEAIRDRQYKLLRFTLYDEETGFRCVSDPQPSVENRLPCATEDRVKSYELYDLLADPQEQNNLLENGEA